MNTIPLDDYRPKRKSRLKLVPFDSIKMNSDRSYLVKGLIPPVGLTVAWGPPKCGKSFWTFDLAMHVALGGVPRPARAAGQSSIALSRARVASSRASKPTGCDTDAEGAVEIFVLPPAGRWTSCRASRPNRRDPSSGRASRSRGARHPEPKPYRLESLEDEDMRADIGAADAIRDAFECAVMVVHHCGVDDTRPRGHTA